MATIEQAKSYQQARGNELWADLSAANAAALLADAEEYIRLTYPIRSDLTAGEQGMFDNVVCRLAGIFQTNPPQGAAAPAVKRESREGAGFKKEVEYEAAGSDPYPYITAVIRPFLAVANRPAVVMGRLVRR